jgi:hypothetical protein
MRFAVVTAALLRIHIFCNVMLCHQVSVSNVFKDLIAFACIVRVLGLLDPEEEGSVVLQNIPEDLQLPQFLTAV